MSDKTPIYLQLDYLDYKDFEEQLKFYKQRETEHRTEDRRFYHKVFTFTLGTVRLEVQGPLVMAPKTPFADIDPDEEAARDAAAADMRHNQELAREPEHR